MPNAFDARNQPFDRLTPAEMAVLRAALDVEYYRPGDAIVSAGADSQSLFVVIKGTVEERDGDEVMALLGPKDSFDTRAIVEGASAHSFLAREEALAYRIPRDLVLRLIRDNARFGSFFYLDISRKLEAAARSEDEAKSGSLMRTRIADLFLGTAKFIDAATTIEQAGQTMKTINANALFVRDGERIGIVTGMNLSKAAILKRMPIDAAVGPFAHYDIVALEHDDFVFMALLEMTKRNKRRIAVRKDGAYIGILEDIDLLGFLAGNAQMVAGRIDRAGTVADLAIASREIAEQVRILRRQDVKVEVIAEIISDLNRRLFAKAFDLIAPNELRTRACLIVMGSEGRGEQTMRTDQDNGLILTEPVDPAILDQFRKNFFDTLESFGFPPCPGEVMVRNPLWSKPLADYIEDFHRWAVLPDENASMNVAIFYDSAAVGGRLDLLDIAKKNLIATVQGERAFLARFAKAVEAFETPIGLFNNLIASEGDGSLDLKKGGIFPIVHGARSLALEHGLLETATEARIAKLAERNVLRESFADDLRKAFEFLMTMRLDQQLQSLSGEKSLIKPGELSSEQRDLLRTSLKIVKQFRDFLRRHYNLGMF